jgi:hypothetical protein
VELRNSFRIIDLCNKEAQYSTWNAKLGAARNQAGIGLWIAVVDIFVFVPRFSRS